MGKQNQDTEENEALILVVDDNQVNVKVLSNILKMSGYDIIAAFNGKDAIRMAERRPPDLILMDIMMPEGCKVLFSRENKAGRKWPADDVNRGISPG